MFIAHETRIDIGFSLARVRLVNLVLHTSLFGASQTAYQAGLTTLIRVGPFGDVPGVAKLVRVSFLEPVERNDSFRVALRWDATGVTSGLFPVLDGDLTLAPDAYDTARLALTGVYRPPLGRIGAALDSVALHKVAEATIRSLLRSVSAAIAQSATASEPAVRESGGLSLADDLEPC